MFLIRITCVLHIMITVLVTGKLLEKCSDDRPCPAPFRCIQRGCDGRMCVCTDDHMPSEDESRCVPIAEIGEQCNKDRRCRGQNSRCDVTGFCVCDPDHVRVHLNVLNITYCKLKHFLVTEPLLIGQSCTRENSLCSDVLGQTECRDGTCKCKPGYRTSTKREINLYPYQLLQCVPLGFDINNSIPANLCPKPDTHTSSITALKPSSSVDISHSSVITFQTSSVVQSSQWTIVRLSSNVESRKSQSPAKDHTVFNSEIESSSSMIKSSSSALVGNTDIASSSREHVSVGMNSLKGINKTTSKIPEMSQSKNSITDSEAVFSNVLKTEYISPSVLPRLSSLEHILQSSVDINSNVVLQSQSSVNIRTSTVSEHLIQPSLTTLHHKVPSVNSSREIISDHAIKPSSSDTLPMSSALSVTFKASKTDSKVIIMPTTTQSFVSLPTSDLVVMTSVTSGVTPQHGSIHSTSVSATTMNPPVSVVTTSSPILRVMDGEACNAPMSCLDGGVCEKDKCGTNRCRSRIGYVFDLSVYRKLQKLGDPCESDANCMRPFTKCIGGLCKCKPDYVMDSNGVWCTHKTSWFIHFPLMGDKCSSFFSECFHSTEQTCEDKKCKCKPGLRKAEKEDLLVPSDNYFQCRNVSLIIGEREPRNCENGVETIPSDPSYSIAIGRIRKMQGIIFGTIAGVVVVICCIIVAVCYIRYRNRTMVKDMRSDNGSEVSFDRQSSGKYSFKIPRPFMPIIKDWDTEQMSYANSAFTSDDTEIPKGDQTLRSSRSIPFPDQSDPEGYNRPNDRNLSISTTSTIDADLASLTENIGTKSIADSPTLEAKSYNTDQTDLKFGEG